MPFTGHRTRETLCLIFEMLQKSLHLAIALVILWTLEKYVVTSRDMKSGLRFLEEATASKPQFTSRQAAKKRRFFLACPAWLPEKK